jgi:hypothetical protein
MGMSVDTSMEENLRAKGVERARMQMLANASTCSARPSRSRS